jgi:hypothetical protein
MEQNLSSEVIVSQLLVKFPDFHGRRRFITIFTDDSNEFISIDRPLKPHPHAAVH